MRRAVDSSPTPAVPAPSLDAPVAYFQAAHQSFQEAVAERGPHETPYLLGGHRIRCCFAGEALLRLLTPALEHRAVGPEETPALTVCLWESAATRTPLADPRWSFQEPAPRSEVEGRNDHRFR